MIYCWRREKNIEEEECMRDEACPSALCRETNPIQLLLFSKEELDACSNRHRN